jgi:hypothetical protein
MVGNEKVKCLKWTMTLNRSSDEASLDKKGLAMKKIGSELTAPRPSEITMTAGS